MDLQRAEHFCAEIQSSVLDTAKHESGLCNELHLLFLYFLSPLSMSESLKIPGSFYVFPSGASLVVGELEPQAEVFRTLFVLQQFLSQLQAMVHLHFKMFLLKIPDSSFFSQSQAQAECV